MSGYKTTSTENRGNVVAIPARKGGKELGQPGAIIFGGVSVFAT